MIIWIISLLKVPIFSFYFQIYIENIVKTANAKLEESKTLYTQAESLLLQELGLDNWQPPKEAVAIKNFSVSFGATGRLDAEYYQPKYDDLENRIKAYPNGWDLIRNVLNKDIKNGTTPSKGVFNKYDEDKYNFVRVEAFGSTLDLNEYNFYSIDEKL